MPASPFLFSRRFDAEHDDDGTVAAPVATPFEAAVATAGADVSTPAEASEPPERAAPEPAPAGYTDADLERVRAAAHAAGRAEAEAASADAAQLRLAAALESIADRLTNATKAAAAMETAWSAAAARIATGVVRKMLPALRRRSADDDVLEVFRSVFAGQAEPAALTVTVAAELHEAVAPKLAELAERQGFAQPVAVTADPEMAAGDCRISWAGGGAVRDQAALWASVEVAVAALAGDARSPETPAETAASDPLASAA